MIKTFAGTGLRKKCVAEEHSRQNAPGVHALSSYQGVRDCSGASRQSISGIRLQMARFWSCRTSEAGAKTSQKQTHIAIRNHMQILKKPGIDGASHADP